MANELWPYRRLQSSSIGLGGWRLSPNGDQLPRYYEGWDSSTDLVIEQRVTCDPEQLLTEVGLEPNAGLVLTASWINVQSFMVEVGYREPLTADQTIEMKLAASRVGGSLLLRTTVAASEAAVERPPGVARYAGSVLFSEETPLVLEGSGPMLPIAELDFAGTAYPPDASWALEVPDDLTLPVLGSVQLLINTRDRELGAALRAPSPDPRQIALNENLEAELGAFMVSEAVARRDELESAEWADQSTGSLLQSYLALANDTHLLAAMSTATSSLLPVLVSAAVRSGGYGRKFQ